MPRMLLVLIESGAEDAESPTRNAFDLPRLLPGQNVRRQMLVEYLSPYGKPRTLRQIAADHRRRSPENIVPPRSADIARPICGKTSALPENSVSGMLDASRELRSL